MSFPGVISNEKAAAQESYAGETCFLRLLNRGFKHAGSAIARRPWLCMGVSLLLTAFTSVRIPLTPMTNDVADFTPYGARARKELETYEQFFSNKGDPITVFILIMSKSPHGNMFGVRELEETVRLLNTVSDDPRFTVYNAAKNRSDTFSQFCDNFCTINEPVRHFYSGLLVETNFGNTSNDHIDLGYPITTVLGRQLHMDPNLFGVKVAFPLPNATDGTNQVEPAVTVVSVNELRTARGQSIFDSPDTVQLPNNVREVKLVVLQFRAERPPGVSKESVAAWELSIVNYVQNEFNHRSEFVSALVLSETFLTTEVVRAGLTLLPFLVIGFCIMVVFSTCTMGLAAFHVGQMSAYKVLLAVVACSCPFMGCGTALGLMFWLGFRFGSLLCVTPFLVLALGVDDAYLMVSAWQRIRQKRQLEEQQESVHMTSNGQHRMGSSLSVESKVQAMFAEVMIDTGASITITTLTNVLAFTIGAMTPTPEIQLFSIGNATAITIAFIYQWTVFGAVMAIVGRRELAAAEALLRRARKQSHGVASTLTSEGSLPGEEEGGTFKSSGISNTGGTTMCSSKSSTASTTSSVPSAAFSLAYRFQKRAQHVCSRFVSWYCALLTSGPSACVVLLALIGYMYTSIYGVLNIRAELRPEQLFLQSSDVVKILHLRNEYVMPFYAVCLVFVNRPGNFSDPAQARRLHQLVAEFESLPSSVGRFSTKFWMRDYEQFVEQSNGGGTGSRGPADNSQDPGDTEALNDLEAFEGVSLVDRTRNELRQFLEWPEFQFWNGFLRLKNNTETGEPRLDAFFFTTASYGPELREWSQRVTLLNAWRRVADSYPDLEVSVYEDEAKFLDLIPTMVPQTVQSSVCTLVCMFLVCLLFMTHPTTVLVSNFAIFSTCVGVFGTLSLLGTDLDPIVMSAAIMSIGFSVDIPAHIAYHYYKTGIGPEATEKSVRERLRHCLSTIGFPVLEAGISTLICVSSLLFVQLHMAQVFARTMVLVVAIGLVHGLLVIPVMFYLISLLPGGSSSRSSYSTTKQQAASDNRSMTGVSSGSGGLLPIVLAVNQHEKF